MKTEVLSHFYKFNGKQNEFLKQFFIRFIRNRIIDPNTQVLLEDGFKYFDINNKKVVNIPSDDSNWCEMCTFKEGFQNNILSFPFSIKLHHDFFLTLNSYDEFLNIFNKMIIFRTDTIKLGWAIKYGTSYNDEDYESLENMTEYQLVHWVDPRPNVTYSLDKVTERDLNL
jgi:hypothetical protein